MGEQTGDHEGLDDAACTFGGGLERFAGSLGEAVQVEAFVPIGAVDERQTVGTQVVEGELPRAGKMIQQRRGEGVVVFKGDRLDEDGKVPGFPEVAAGAENEPERVVVEVRAVSELPRLVSLWYWS